MKAGSSLIKCTYSPKYPSRRGSVKTCSSEGWNQSLAVAAAPLISIQRSGGLRSALLFVFSHKQVFLGLLLWWFNTLSQILFSRKYLLCFLPPSVLLLHRVSGALTCVQPGGPGLYVGPHGAPALIRGQLKRVPSERRRTLDLAF